LEPLSEKSDADFGRRVRGLAHGLWAGTIDWSQFADSLADAIYRGYEQAWREGASRCGISPAERSDAERIALQREITADVGRVRGFGDWISAHSKALGFKEATVLSRASIWTNRYNSVATLAQVTACADQKLRWKIGSTHEHCADCLTYNGKVYRASVWRKYAAIPQSSFLECGGWRCECTLNPTRAPVTPGHPRYPGGGR
jgi:hypothetical protein